MPLPSSHSSIVGITSTIPVEIIFSAGLRPLDLNNAFITSDRPGALISQAEAAGFAHNTCAWIKGIYSTVMNKGLDKVVAVTGGDCSNTIALGEVLERRGVRVIHFDYPFSRDGKALWEQMDRLRGFFSTSWQEIETTRSRLDSIRRKLRRVDELTYLDNVATGWENHFYLVNSSDFMGDPDEFERELDGFLKEIRGRRPKQDKIRLGYLGVPPIFSGLYDFIESLGGRVVFNEVQRQFSMPFGKESLVDQYLAYTYPYDVGGRLQDIEQAVQERALDGVIHYTQSFCYRQIYDIVFRENLSIPVLTLEGDKPGQIDSRIALRIETLIEMLKNRKPWS